MNASTRTARHTTEIHTGQTKEPPMPALFTPCPGGFVITRRLDDGRILVEGYVFAPTPFDGGDPHHSIFYSCVRGTDDEATAMVTEFTNELTNPLNT
ncbi:hypothetical protein ACGFZR_15170 [Streptomyces sp. NPDC048241]|uniref:hypothetical protein n=1 Tax=Streptomyces sp. NPDC048241 TaxID=3365521 RepID=UPI0037184741